MQLEKIQQELRTQKLDGWLFFDHHLRDPLAYRVLGFEPPRTPTRRWYYLIPGNGEPRGLEHRVEPGMIASLPGEKIPYSSWPEQVEGLRRITAALKRVAMQYSPNCAIPYISMVDGGTIELVRSTGVDVVTSAELIQFFEARWTAGATRNAPGGRQARRRGARGGVPLVLERLRSGAKVTELDMKNFVRAEFTRAGMVTDEGPIAAVNSNASNPHYEPTANRFAEIHMGDLLLLDLWAKLDQPEAVYYDITWTHFLGEIRRTPCSASSKRSRARGMPRSSG